MKARFEFPSNAAYYEYLRNYYAGLAMANFIQKIEFITEDLPTTVSMFAMKVGFTLANQIEESKK